MSSRLEDPVAESKSGGPSFAETALKLGGKSDEEARRTGAIDAADDQVERLFARAFQTVSSPAHRAVWDRGVPVELFTSAPVETLPDLKQAMDSAAALVKRHRDAGTIYNAEGKIADEVLAELGAAGYWGLLVDREHGGLGARFPAFAAFLTRMATIEPTVAGMASVHGCIGAVDPVRTFGSEEQKRRFLPKLASGERLSGFALTEPGAGSDLTALRTTARLEGDHYVVNGEKLFITNVVPGRMLGLVCLVDREPAVLVAELPEAENEHFQLRKYGLWALKRTYNRGIVFRDFRVPKENLLQPRRGDGLTIAYHGLNLGRIALCATAAGTMRSMLASMIPWANYRTTYGQRIANRELVRRRLGEMAGLIVGCDALVAWCSQLIDQGYRGEMECVVAKIFGSESQKHAAVEYFMKTHGGRSFLAGHPFGENVHEYLAPCIYEGEGEMLAMGFFKSLVKEHGKAFFEPIGKLLAERGIKKPNPWNPAHAWALRSAAVPYLKWMAGRRMSRPPRPELPAMSESLRQHAEFACSELQGMALEISGTMSKFQLALADRQCRMSELSQRCQDLITILCAALYGARQEDEMVRDAADLLCQRLADKYAGRRASNRYFRQVTELGAAIADGGFALIGGIDSGEILMKY
ncbi:MAG: acyl-CoA/acyl-ACP dehydrogenase [Pirellulales bacterium]|nr:acyl-CoA/acyl-ACP dehydrogenase [Pirellulales bacterium]